MKRIDKPAIYFSFFLLFAISCTPQSKNTDNKKVQDANATIEKQKGQFNPAFQNMQQSSHYGVKVDFNNGMYQVVPGSLTRRPGRLPYTKNSGGNFKVEFKNANNAAIGNYFIEDPTTIRSCDEGGKPFIKTLTQGSFYLLLPPDSSIASVVFTKNDKAVSVPVPVGRLVSDTLRTGGNDVIK